MAGPNGGGKTTLVRLVLGLARPTAGDVRLFGEPAHRFSRRATLGYVAQRAQVGGRRARSPCARSSPSGRLAQGGLLGPLAAPRPRDRRRGDRRRRPRRPGRRPALGASRAASSSAPSSPRRSPGEPSLLVLDEPTAGVDAESQESLARLLGRLHRDRGVTTLYVSHEFGAVEGIVDRLVLVRGGIVFDGPPQAAPVRVARPVARPCSRLSSCASRSRRGPSSASSRPAVGFFLVQRNMSLVGRRHRPHRLRRGRRGLPAGRLARRSPRSCRGRRRRRDRVAALAAPRGR